MPSNQINKREEKSGWINEKKRKICAKFLLKEKLILWKKSEKNLVKFPTQRKFAEKSVEFEKRKMWVLMGCGGEEYSNSNWSWTQTLEIWTKYLVLYICQ